MLLFVLAFSLRLWNLNLAGRTWDEQSIIEKGYNLVQLAKSGDFLNSYWYSHPDHPPLASYIYGLAATKDFIKYDKTESPSYPFSKGATIFQYDLTYSRLVAVLFSSLAVILVFFIGLRYFSLLTGLTAGLILALMPQFLGYSQLVDNETLITFFFTASAFSYLLFFEKKTKLLLAIAGILTGLTLELKQSNILLFILLFGLFFLWRRFHPKEKTIRIKHLIAISLIAVATYVALWPMPLFHLQTFITFNYDTWFRNGGRIPELLFGIHMGAPFLFYVVAFFVTTPLVILLLTLYGAKMAFRKMTWITWTMLLWFAVPFTMSLFHDRNQMVRYIVEFYAPLALLAAIGFEQLVKNFKKTSAVILLIAGLALYLLLLDVNISPYYLDYYNELVGGTHMVYQYKLFFLGEWGQGLRNPGIYVAKHAAKNSLIGLAIDPTLTVYYSPQLKYALFNPKQKYDYVIVNYFDVLRIGFNENALKKDYKLVYTERADGAELAHVYQKK
jgi:4-amino-4-deoxy-L-arabinose transferase-like glycosyltransferase